MITTEPEATVVATLFFKGTLGHNVTKCEKELREALFGCRINAKKITGAFYEFTLTFVDKVTPKEQRAISEIVSGNVTYEWFYKYPDRVLFISTSLSSDLVIKAINLAGYNVVGFSIIPHGHNKEGVVRIEAENTGYTKYFALQLNKAFSAEKIINNLPGSEISVPPINTPVTNLLNYKKP